MTPKGITGKSANSKKVKFARESTPIAYDDGRYNPFRMSNIVKCIDENDVRELSKQLRV